MEAPSDTTWAIASAALAGATAWIARGFGLGRAYGRLEGCLHALDARLERIETWQAQHDHIDARSLGEINQRFADISAQLNKLQGAWDSRSDRRD